MPDRFKKRWGLSRLVPTRQIPVEIFAIDDGKPDKAVFLCEQDPDLYDGYVLIVKQHNAEIDQ